MSSPSSAFLQDDGEYGSRLYPMMPRTVDELGLPKPLLLDLVLRYLREQRAVTVGAMSNALKLPRPVADEVFQQLRQLRMIDVEGMSGVDYVFSLTSSARQKAAESLSVCRYAGPVPVPLDQYTQMVRSQSSSVTPTRDDLRSALREIVVTDHVLDQIGAALTSGRPIFVYGPSGNGKSSTILRLPRLFKDEVLIPYCVEADGHIISVFDPAIHKPLENPEPPPGADPRWVRCRRPCVIAGGELVLEAFSLRLDPTSGLYAAPLQMKAANGIMLIDDFGRQTTSPRELFNRWMMPLDTRTDYLSLVHGFTFQIPFEVTLVFSTNLRPADLVDEAFIRRVPNKIYLGPVTPEAFDEIFGRVVARLDLPFDPHMAASLRQICARHGAHDLRGCYPTDICHIMAALAAYERKPLVVSEENLSRAAELYFIQQFELTDPQRP